MTQELQNIIRRRRAPSLTTVGKVRMLSICKSNVENADGALSHSFQIQSASDLSRHETERRPMEFIHYAHIGEFWIKEGQFI